MIGRFFIYERMYHLFDAQFRHGRVKRFAILWVPQLELSTVWFKIDIALRVVLRFIRVWF